MAGTPAGFERILVHGLPFDGALVGTRAHQLTSADARPQTRRRVVLIPANLVPQPDWLRSLIQTPVEPDTLYVDASLAALIETSEAELVLSAASRCGSARDLVGALRTRFSEAEWRFDLAGRFPVAASVDIEPAERWLLRSLIKPSEGVMSRHLERRISLALTRRLMATRVTPNAMTLVSVAIGLLGAPCFLSPAPLVQLAGALVFLAHSILDGCDGELARLKFLESRHGALLDFWGDNIVHVAVFGSMAIGWSLHLATAWPLVVGAVAVVSTLGGCRRPFGAHHRAPRPRRPAILERAADRCPRQPRLYLPDHPAGDRGTGVVVPRSGGGRHAALRAALPRGRREAARLLTVPWLDSSTCCSAASASAARRWP